MCRSSLSPWKDENGNYSVAIDTRNHIGKNKNLNVLQMLRKQIPQIKTFTEVAKALGIKRDRLEYAIFSGDFEIIEEYIFSRTTGEIYLKNIEWILINVGG